MRLFLLPFQPRYSLLTLVIVCAAGFAILVWQNPHNALAVAADFAGNADIISLVLQTDTGSADVLGSLSWKELV